MLFLLRFDFVAHTLCVLLCYSKLKYSAAADYQKYFDVGGTDEIVRQYLNDAKKKIE